MLFHIRVRAASFVVDITMKYVSVGLAQYSINPYNATVCDFPEDELPANPRNLFFPQSPIISRAINSLHGVHKNRQMLPSQLNAKSTALLKHSNLFSGVNDPLENIHKFASNSELPTGNSIPSTTGPLWITSLIIKSVQASSLNP